MHASPHSFAAPLAMRRSEPLVIWPGGGGRVSYPVPLSPGDPGRYHFHHHKPTHYPVPLSPGDPGRYNFG